MNRATIIIYTEVNQVNGVQFLKYRNVDLKAGNIPNKEFLDFAKKFPGIKHMNLYNPKLPKGHNFIRQIQFDREKNDFKLD